MKKSGKLIAGIVLSVILVTAIPVNVYAADNNKISEYEATENEIVKLFNEARENAGMEVLEQDEKLTELARIKAEEMAEKRWKTVEFPNGIKQFLKDNSAESKVGNYYSAAGKKTAAEVVKIWEKKIGFDRDTWASEKTTHIGVGVVKALDGTFYYVCIVTKPFGNVEKTAIEDELIGHINAERGKAGLDPVAKNADLTKAARFKAYDMAEKDYTAHKSPLYGYPDKMVEDITGISRPVGENVAAGQTTAQEVFDAWMDSPAHKAHLLNPRITDIGVGVAINKDNRFYWSLMSFGGNYIW